MYISIYSPVLPACFLFSLLFRIVPLPNLLHLLLSSIVTQKMTSIAPSRPSPTIAVVGGGVGGLALAKAYSGATSTSKSMEPPQNSKKLVSASPLARPPTAPCPLSIPRFETSTTSSSPPTRTALAMSIYARHGMRSSGPEEENALAKL